MEKSHIAGKKSLLKPLKGHSILGFSRAICKYKTLQFFSTLLVLNHNWNLHIAILTQDMNWSCLERVKDTEVTLLR